MATHVQIYSEAQTGDNVSGIGQACSQSSLFNQNLKHRSGQVSSFFSKQVFLCKSVEMHLKAGSFKSKKKKNTLFPLGKKKWIRFSQGLSLAINDEEFLLTSELVIGTKMSCLSGTTTKNIVKFKTGGTLNTLTPIIDCTDIICSHFVGGSSNCEHS